MASVHLPVGDTLGTLPVLRIQTESRRELAIQPTTPIMAPDKALLSIPATPETPIIQKNLQEFQRSFEDNMQNKPVKHDKTFVLLLSWAEELDDLKVKPELDKLEGFLKKSYGFEVEKKQLGHEKPGQALDHRKLAHQLHKYLSAFLEEYDEQDRLLIIYYGGHGRFQDDFQTQRQGMELHSSSSQTKRFKIAWADAHSLIKTRADVLVIFDCCQAGGFPGTKIRGPEPNFDFLAACGPNQPAAPPGDKSFTTAFIWALKEFKRSDECPFTSSSLLDKVKARLKSVNPEGNQVPELHRCNPTSNGIVWIAPQIYRTPLKRRAPQAERRHAHHEFIDLRFNFFRRVELQDTVNVAKHLSRLVNDKDDFAKHITLINVSNPVIGIVNHWKSEMEKGKRKRDSSISSNVFTEQIYDASPSTDISIYGPDQGRTMEVVRMRKRQRLDESVEISAVPNTETPQVGGAMFHLRMFLDCSFQWMATRVRPRLR